MSLINPFRYAAMIGSAAQSLSRPLNQIDATSSLPPEEQVLLKRFAATFCRPTSETIRTAIRGLFLKNLVDVRALGFGYGDCLQMCRFDMTPLDPLLFW